MSNDYWKVRESELGGVSFCREQYRNTISNAQEKMFGLEFVVALKAMLFYSRFC